LTGNFALHILKRKNVIHIVDGSARNRVRLPDHRGIATKRQSRGPGGRIRRHSATLLSKATTASAIVFMVTSLALSIMETRGSSGVKTVLDSSSGGATKSAPAKPAAPLASKGPTVKMPNGQTIPLQIPPASQGQKAPAAPAPKK
jgi:preprotein translocase subunit SecG